MYERKSQLTSGETECRPDYEEQAKRQANELEIIKKLKDGLMEFIMVVRPYGRKDGDLPAFLGNLIIDIEDREIALENTLKMIEKYK